MKIKNKKIIPEADNYTYGDGFPIEDKYKIDEYSADRDPVTFENGKKTTSKDYRFTGTNKNKKIVYKK